MATNADMRTKQNQDKDGIYCSTGNHTHRGSGATPESCDNQQTRQQVRDYTARLQEIKKNNADLNKTQYKINKITKKNIYLSIRLHRLLVRILCGQWKRAAVAWRSVSWPRYPEAAGLSSGFIRKGLQRESLDKCFVPVQSLTVGSS